MSSYINEKASGLGPDVIHTSLPEDANPKLDEQTVKELQAEQDAHLGVKAVEAAEKVYGRYSKWLLFIGSVLRLPYRLVLNRLPYLLPASPS